MPIDGRQLTLPGILKGGSLDLQSGNKSEPSFSPRLLTLSSHLFSVRMSSNNDHSNDSSESESIAGQKRGRPSALELGPRKKA